MHTYLPIIFSFYSYFHLLFLTDLAKRHILQFTMFDDFIKTCPYITEIKKHSMTKTNSLI